MISSPSRLAGPATNQPVQPTMMLWPSKRWSRSVPTRSAQAMKNGVRMGRSLVQGLGHCGPPRFLAGDRHPVGGDADDVRALERLQPKSLGKPTIVTDSDAEAADRRPKD